MSQTNPRLGNRIHPLGRTAASGVVTVVTGPPSAQLLYGQYVSIRQRPVTSVAVPSASSPAPADVTPPASGAPDSATVTPRYGERAIAEAQLICFDNPRPGRPFEVSIELPEFTCSCPFSGYPDFAVLRLLYQPGPRVLELKALKLYINSYRDRAISHEEVANRILDDLVAAADPTWMELVADFNPRGNVHTVVRVSHGTRQSC